ncbi:outer membrane protein assembly factor BamE [Helicobacter sp. MIT 11-5569]|uniref:outer membrane protein assembly factor BamE domain-containing protein n=1 Tax=Helicobacter sp. MIT 11-5569 TaxID=1548151 RepID=UPI00051F9A96|nr:outer membrane protein assembly factor BamE [Helicobacter sp. MIT 11-5569]TLD84491.1 outer membrane protein assembly factor BamE [Helicobacter sp. MIT 11-5569]
MKSLLGFCLFGLFILSGCSSLYNPQSDEKISVAKAQKEIKVGMSSAEVVEVLGSPNIISTDEQRREVWVYDKVSTQQAYQNTQGGIGLILLGVGGSSGSTARNQRTLTIIVKFDAQNKVRDVSYRTSSF